MFQFQTPEYKNSYTVDDILLTQKAEWLKKLKHKPKYSTQLRCEQFIVRILMFFLRPSVQMLG
jgi:hypothetical protein